MQNYCFQKISSSIAPLADLEDRIVSLHCPTTDTQKILTILFVYRQNVEDMKSFTLPYIINGKMLPEQRARKETSGKADKPIANESETPFRSEQK